MFTAPVEDGAQHLPHANIDPKLSLAKSIDSKRLVQFHNSRDKSDDDDQ